MAERSERDNAVDGDEQEDEEIDEMAYKTMKDAVLFAIDVSPSMLKRPPPSESKKADRDSATSAALKCAYQLMQQRIISHPNDMMGILLFGTEQTKFEEQEEGRRSTFQFPHCYLLSDLRVPAAHDVKRVRNLLEDDEDQTSLLKASKEPVAMSNVLFCANQIFMTRAANFSSRRLFLVTDNDDPHSGKQDARASAVVRAKDLYDLGVSVELFPISQPGREFDTGKFYDDIVYRPPQDPEAPAPVSKSVPPSARGDGITLLQSLLTSMHSKQFPKRALFSNLPLELSPDLKISVNGYIVFKRQSPKRSCYIWMDGETPRIVEGLSRKVADDSGRPVEKAEIRRAFKFGNDQVTFSQEEYTALLSFGEPVIRIIGFKPQSFLPIWANLRTSTFVYPSEEAYVGSTRVFSALQQTLLRKEKFALVWYIARRNASPVLAALMPGTEKLDDSGAQLEPPGLWIIPLPFADDIRQNPEINSVARAPDILVDKMRNVMVQLQLPGAKYDPSRYPNAQLQWHYLCLQSQALEEDLPDQNQREDKTIPRYRQIHKRAGAYVREWGDELNKQFEDWQRARRAELGLKRDHLTSGEGAAPASKKIKAENESQALSDERMKEYVHKGTLNRLNVPDLKMWLKTRGLSVTGAKQVLVDRISGVLERTE